jgi:hypothetical protein
MNVDRRIADAVKLARDPLRLQCVSNERLSAMAVLVARGVTMLADRGGSRVLRADVLRVTRRCRARDRGGNAATSGRYRRNPSASRRE